MNFQIRIRTDAAFNDLEYINHWLDAAREGFAFEHNKPGNHHYHIYLFGLDRKPDPMRKYLFKYLPNKECYSVGITAGKKKEKIIDWLAYQYGTTKLIIDPCWTKGYEAAKLNEFRDSAIAFYEQETARQERRNAVVTEILVINNEKVKPDRVWEGLVTKLIEKPDMYDGKTIPQIKSMISVDYLRRLKAVPRPSDLHRYAISLWYIVKYDAHVKDSDIPLDAMEGEYTR